MKPNDANNLRFLYYAKLYIISIMQLAEMQESSNLITTTTHFLLIVQ